MKKLAVIAFGALALAGCDTADVTSAATDAGQIGYQSSVTLDVGQSAVVHGLRGDCGSLPTDEVVASSTEALNARTSLGTFSFGAPGVRNSGACGGDTPARQTVFTATASGQETINVHGDPVTITVR